MQKRTGPAERSEAESEDGAAAKPSELKRPKSKSARRSASGGAVGGEALAAKGS
jgi:hypothetical protein